MPHPCLELLQLLLQLLITPLSFSKRRRLVTVRRQQRLALLLRGISPVTTEGVHQARVFEQARCPAASGAARRRLEVSVLQLAALQDHSQV